MTSLDQCSSSVSCSQPAPIPLMDIPMTTHCLSVDTEGYRSGKDLNDPDEESPDQKPEQKSTSENRIQPVTVSTGLTSPRKRLGFKKEKESNFSEKPFKGWKERNQQRKMKKYKKNKTFGYHQSYGDSQNFGGISVQGNSNMNEIQGTNNMQGASNVGLNSGGRFVPPNMNSQSGQWSVGPLQMPTQMQPQMQTMPPMHPATVQNQGQNAPVVSGMPSTPINYPSGFPPPNVIPTNIPPPNFRSHIPPPNYQQQQHPTAPVQTSYIAGPQQYQSTIPTYNPTIPPPVSQLQYQQQVPQMSLINQQGQLPQFSSAPTLVQPQGYSNSQTPQQNPLVQSVVPSVPCGKQGYTTPQAHQLPLISSEKNTTVNVQLPINQGQPSPPPPRPTHKRPALPPNWKTATDPEGKVYYYHSITR